MDLWKEYQYRQIIPMSAEQFEDEPGVKVDYFLAFQRIEHEIQAEQIEKVKRDAQQRR